MQKTIIKLGASLTTEITEIKLPKSIQRNNDQLWGEEHCRDSVEIHQMFPVLFGPHPHPGHDT